MSLDSHCFDWMKHLQDLFTHCYPKPSLCHMHLVSISISLPLLPFKESQYLIYCLLLNFPVIRYLDHYFQFHHHSAAWHKEQAFVSIPMKKHPIHWEFGWPFLWYSCADFPLKVLLCAISHKSATIFSLIRHYPQCAALGIPYIIIRLIYCLVIYN